MRSVLIRALARQDIADHYVYLFEQAGPAVAERPVFAIWPIGRPWPRFFGRDLWSRRYAKVASQRLRKFSDLLHDAAGRNFDCPRSPRRPGLVAVARYRKLKMQDG